MTWAQRCWDDPKLLWTEDCVRAWVARHVPPTLQDATRSVFIDPIIWSGPGYYLGNGQTRYLALMGAGVEEVLVSRV